MSKYPLIRTIYLYLFSLLGLVLLTIGGVRFLDMGLKAFIFTQAEQQEKILNRQPPMIYNIERTEKIEADEELSEEEKVLVRQWLADYKNWQEEVAKVDYVTSRRHRDASMNLSLILIGLPLYLYHWGVIKKEIKKQD